MEPVAHTTELITEEYMKYLYLVFYNKKYYTLQFAVHLYLICGFTTSLQKILPPIVIFNFHSDHFCMLRYTYVCMCIVDFIYIVYVELKLFELARMLTLVSVFLVKCFPFLYA